MKTINPLVLKDWMTEKKLTQTDVADMIGTSHTTVGRWLKGVHAISEPERKLLAYLIYGELPFGIVANNNGWHIDFTNDEFALLSMISRREGFDKLEDWFAAKIRAYLLMANACADTVHK